MNKTVSLDESGLPTIIKSNDEIPVNKDYICPECMINDERSGVYLAGFTTAVVFVGFFWFGAGILLGFFLWG